MRGYERTCLGQLRTGFDTSELKLAVQQQLRLWTDLRPPSGSYLDRGKSCSTNF